MARSADIRTGRYLHLVRLVVDAAVTHTHQPTFFHHLHEPRADDQRLRGADHAEEVPPAREPDCFLQTAGADVADGRGAGVGQEEDRDGGLLEGQEQADVRVEGGEDDVALFAEVVDFGEDGVDEGVELDGVGIHFLFFAFVEHGVFCR